MKKYMGYLPIGLLCLIVLFSQLIYTRRNDFHVALRTIAQEGERIGDPEAIRDFAYSFYIADTNFSSFSTMSQNAWRVDAVGDQFKLRFDPEGYKNGPYRGDETSDSYLSVEAVMPYNEKTMPMDDAHGNCDSYDQTGDFGCTYETSLERLSYDVTIQRQRIEGNKLRAVGKKFTKHYIVKSKDGKASIPVSYHAEEIDGEQRFFVNTGFSMGNADDRYGDLKEYSAESAPIVNIEQTSFTAIGALQFQVNFDQVEFEKDPTGIYRVDPYGTITRIVTTDVNKETIIRMKAFKGKLVTIVEKGGKLYVRVYSTQGKQLDEFQLPKELTQTSRIMLQTEGNHILIVQEPIYDSNRREVLIYGLNKERIALIDHLVLLSPFLGDIESEYPDSLIHYEEKTGVLYTLVQDNFELYVTAQKKDKALYSSTVLGDYMDDSRLDFPDTTPLSGNSAYENIVGFLLNTQKRTLQNLSIVQDGAS